MTQQSKVGYNQTNHYHISDSYLLAIMTAYIVFGLLVLLLTPDRNTSVKDLGTGSSVQKDNAMFELTGSMGNERQKRAGGIHLANAAMAGVKAVKKLIKGSKPIPTLRTYRVYEKPGFVEEAIDDFYSVNPEDVIHFNIPGPEKGYGVAGTIGDRQLILKSVGKKGTPTLDIIKVISRTDSTGKKAAYGKITERITYTYKD